MKRTIAHKPELSIDTNGREVSTRMGQYSDHVTMQLAQKHQGKLVSIKDIVRVQYGRVNKRNEQYVRNKLTKAVNGLLKAGIPAFPVYQTSGHHQKVGIKVITEYNADDFRQLTEYQEAAVTRGDLSREKADLIKKAMQSLHEETNNSENEMRDSNSTEEPPHAD